MVIPSDDNNESTDNNTISVDSEESKKQEKLADMINKMKAPSNPKKVNLVPLKKGQNAEECKNEITEPSKTMTQQMIELLDEVKYNCKVNNELEEGRKPLRKVNQGGARG